MKIPSNGNFIEDSIDPYKRNLIEGPTSNATNDHKANPRKGNRDENLNGHSSKEVPLGGIVETEDLDGHNHKFSAVTFECISSSLKGNHKASAVSIEGNPVKTIKEVDAYSDVHGSLSSDGTSDSNKEAALHSLPVHVVRLRHRQKTKRET